MIDDATTNERLLEVALDLAECLEIETSSKRDDGSTYTRIDATPIRELVKRYRDLCAHYYTPKPPPGGEATTESLVSAAHRAMGHPVVEVGNLGDRAIMLQRQVDQHRPEIAEVAFARFLVQLATDLFLGHETFAHARGRLVAQIEAEDRDGASVIVIAARPNRVGWAGRLWARLVDFDGERVLPARARRATAVGEDRSALLRALVEAGTGAREVCEVCGRPPPDHAPGCAVAYAARG